MSAVPPPDGIDSKTLSQFLSDFEQIASVDAASPNTASSGAANASAADHKRVQELLHRSKMLERASDEQLVELIEAFAKQPAPADAADPPGMFGGRTQFVSTCLAHVLAGRHRAMREGRRIELGPATLQKIETWYRSLPADSLVRGQLLALLVVPPGVGVERFVEFIVEDPPSQDRASDFAFASLFQMPDVPVERIFPRLFDAMRHRGEAAAVVDFANHIFRSGRVKPHPGAERSGSFATILGQIVQRLGQMEEDPSTYSGDPDAVASQVASSVQLAVSLCDALALIGDRDAVGKLYQAMELRHRRLRCEAAAALVRLGEKAGTETLCELAKEPVARLRVIHYARELGITDKIDEEFRTPTARAEAELAAWLAEPSQFGLAPTSMELLDMRTQHWPGYEEPRDSYLFRFHYDFPQGSYSNIGIAGPLTHTTSSDLADFPPDDIYAAFAGWDATHQDIFEIGIDELPESLKADVARLERRLRDDGYDAIQVHSLGSFFGERSVIASATKNGNAGAAIADDHEVYWFPNRTSHRSLSPIDAYNIVKGRKLLRAFN